MEPSFTWLFLFLVSIISFLVATQDSILEVGKFFEKYNLPKLTSEEKEHLKRPITFKENRLLKTPKPRWLH